MEHWTTHAFHAAVVSPHLMYDDVTVDFADGKVTFAGRPLRNWRAWTLVGAVVRLVVLAAGAVALVSVAQSSRVLQGLTNDSVIRLAVVVVVSLLAWWVAGRVMSRLARASRARGAERVARVPLSDVSGARLSGRVLSLRAPFDRANHSDRWRLKLDSHGQGEGLMALLNHL